MDFEAYLISKRIDSARFNSAEPALWQSWRTEFEQVHPNSFTVQKLYLINPIRRKYQLVVTDPPKSITPSVAKTSPAPAAKTVMKVPRPGIPKVPVGPTEPAATVTSSEASDTIHQKPESADNVPTDRQTINEAPANSTLASTALKPDCENLAPPVKPAKPVIPRPVIKPKPKTN
jgi:hypothetical protein